MLLEHISESANGSDSDVQINGTDLRLRLQEQRTAYYIGDQITQLVFRLNKPLSEGVNQFSIVESQTPSKRISHNFLDQRSRQIAMPTFDKIGFQF